MKNKKPSPSNLLSSMIGTSPETNFALQKIMEKMSAQIKEDLTRMDKEENAPTSYISTRVLIDLEKKRVAQDEQWGGPDGDDTNTEFDWMCYINKQLCKIDAESTADDYREVFLNIAGLSVAAMESLDRLETGRIAIANVETLKFGESTEEVLKNDND